MKGLTAMANEQTSPYVASLALLGARDPSVLSEFEIQSICASALSEVADRRRANAMAGDERTSRHAASLAARGVEYPRLLTVEEIQAVCGSVLTQASHDALIASASGAHARHR
jgi:hypothetical protein